MMRDDVLVVGGGLFGLTASLALRARGRRVALLDPGPLPHPRSASTDLSKVVRIEYGADEVYAALAERARDGWRRWNDELPGEPLYHEVGMAMLTRAPMAPGDFEYENFQSLRRRGHDPERLTAATIAERFPAWNAETYVDGYFNPKAGFVESGLVIERLAELAARAGVTLHLGQTATGLLVAGGSVGGVTTSGGERLEAGQILVAAGAWTPLLVPELAPLLRPTAQPVFHLRPPDPSRFVPPRFSVFGADSARTGWYGFPLHPRAGVVKLAHHGPGRRVHPDEPRRVTPGEERRLRAFLAETFPDLAAAAVVARRSCLYCDTPDEHFWIARHPERARLTVASGDSGHGFKFGPILGDLIADVVEATPNPDVGRFAWREFTGATAGQEASRHRGDGDATAPVAAR